MFVSCVSEKCAPVRRTSHWNSDQCRHSSLLFAASVFKKFPTLPAQVAPQNTFFKHTPQKISPKIPTY